MLQMIQQIPTVWYYLAGWGFGGFILGLLVACFLYRYVGSE